MLFQPSSISPSNFTGTGTIDVSDDLTVSWQVNGNSPMSAYIITIYQNTTTSNQLYTTGKVTLATPFYGTDNTGLQQTFYATAIPSATLVSAGMVNGYADGYKLNITQYWYEAGTEQSLDQTSAAYFITRTTPTLVIDAFTQPITTRMETFTATYTQAEGDPLNWVRWYIAESANKGTPLVDTGDIYGTAELKVEYDGFFTDTTYAVRCVIQTSNGITVDTGWQEFSVVYTIAEDVGAATACRVSGENSILLNWSAQMYIYGAATGNYSISNAQLSLPANSSVLFGGSAASVNFESPFSFAWRGQVSYSAISTTVMSATMGTSTLSLMFTPTQIALKLGSSTLFSTTIALQQGDWFTVVVTPTNYYIRQETITGALYPNTTVYPSTTLYPSAGQKSVVNLSGALTWTQGAITGMTLHGIQVCEYLWLYSGTYSTALITSLTQTAGYLPSFDDDSYLLTLFDEELYTRVAGTTGDTMAGAAIYRQMDGSGTLEHLADIPNGINTARDYGARSQSTYVYYIAPKGILTYTSPPFATAPVTPVFWDYTLLVCDGASDGTFHVATEYKFANNISTGATGNNSNPNIMENFTQYPTFQSKSANFKSGTLTTLIGAVDTYLNTYTDTYALADQIMALSVSTSPMFLKNRKGDVLRVRISGAISMQINDTSPLQQITASIPWVEIGSTDGLTIISTPADSAWPVDQITTSTLSIDTDTMLLSWTKAYPYNYGTSLAINGNGELVATSSNGYVAATLARSGNELLATVNNYA